MGTSVEVCFHDIRDLKILNFQEWKFSHISKLEHEFSGEKLPTVPVGSCLINNIRTVHWNSMQPLKMIMHIYPQHHGPMWGNFSIKEQIYEA